MGSDGSDGTNGTNGANGVSGYQLASGQRTFDNTAGGANPPLNFTMSCPAGTKAIGGGFALPPGPVSAPMTPWVSAPLPDGSGWQVSLSDASLMTATFTIRNQGKRRIKDLTIHCDHSGPSGTVMDSNERVIYEAIPAGKTKVIRDFNMGFIARQAVRSNCRVTDLVVE
jgi:hypothetical protein